MTTEILKGLIGVEVPEGAKDIGIVPGHPDYLYFNDKFGHDGSCEIPLPKEIKWQFIFLSSTASEEDAAGVVEHLTLTGDETRAYENYGFGLPKYKTALESLQSLLKKHNLKEPVAILKQIK